MGDPPAPARQPLAFARQPVAFVRDAFALIGDPFAVLGDPLGLANATPTVLGPGRERLGLRGIRLCCFCPVRHGPQIIPPWSRDWAICAHLTPGPRKRRGPSPPTDVRAPLSREHRRRKL